MYKDFSAASQWIWDDGEPSPRNAWRCFRRTFTLEQKEPNATIQLTADSRYVAYVNGTQIGHGPVRGYAHRWHVDTWDIGHLLRPGDNTISVLVLHFGVATFAYQRNRGGLLAEVDLPASGEILGTDSSWLVTTHGGHEPRMNRLAIQLAFVENIDARWQPTWTEVDHDHSDWRAAQVIAGATDGPWTLVERAIPALAEKLVLPQRVESIAFVTPPRFSTAIELRSHLFPSADDDSNPVTYVSFLITVIRVEETAEVSIAMPWSGGRVSAICVDGTWHQRESFEPSRLLQTLRAELAPGDHWIAWDVSGFDAGQAVPLIIDSDAEFSVRSPYGDSESPFATIGPLGESDPEWVRPLAHPNLPRLASTDEQRQAVAGTTSLDSLQAWGSDARPVAAAFVSPVSLASEIVHPRTHRSVTTPVDLQRMASVLATRIPLETGQDTEVILDFGREFSGFIEFDIEAPAGTIFDFTGVEYLRGEYREEMGGMDNSMRYIARAGRQTYRSPTRRGMRFLQVVVRPPESAPGVTIHSLGVVESHYPVAKTGTFHSSDPLLEPIWEMCRRTVIACMEDTYVDCPGYEQVYWVGDAYSSSRFAGYLFGAEALTERCLRLVPESRDQTELYGSQVPSGWTNVIPNWTFLWVMACREHWFRTGDQRFAADLLPAITATLDAYNGHLNADGLLEIDAWNLLDWAAIDQPNSGVVALQNFLLIEALEAAAELAAACHDTREDDLRKRAELLRSAAAEVLWSHEDSAYIDAIHSDGTRSQTRSVHSQLFAMRAKVGDAGRLERLEELVLDPPEGYVLIGSPWMSIFLTDALADRGRTSEALDDIRKHYGEMLAHGAQTCWETYPNSTISNGRLTRSHCHAWSAGPAAFLPARVLGVRPLSPGWTEVLVAPEPADLDWADGDIPLPTGGAISVRWNKTGPNMINISVRAPEEIAVSIEIPDQYTGTTEVTPP